MHSLLKKIALPLILLSGFLVLYISHLSRGVYGGDVGDLVTAAAVGGVAHPPGYPLFTFLGFLLAHSVFASISPAFAVGLLSSCSAALGVVCFFLITRQLTKSNLTAVIASSILGFSFLYWFYAEVAEVFAMNAFFALALFLFAIVYRQTKKNIFLFSFFFLLGLSCTHHQTIVLLFPSLLLLIASNVFASWKKKSFSLLWGVVFFLLGLIPFLYVFIASAHNPIINWDGVHDIPSFFHLIFRKDYGTFQAGLFETPSFAQRIVTIWVYFQYLIFQLTIPVVALSLVGYVKIFKKDKILFTAIVLAWLLSGPVFLAYAGFPLTSGFIIGAYERFTLLSSVIFLIPFGIGLLTFIQFLVKFLPKRNYEMIFQCLFFFIPLMLFIYNFPKTNLASVTIGNTYARDFLDILPSHAILLISGDSQIFNTWYMHYVLHDRPDVIVYNIGATPVNNNIIANSLVNVSSKKRNEVLVKILEKLQSQKPIFSTQRFQSKSSEQITWVPYGLTYQMYLPKDKIPDKETYENTTNKIWSMLHVPTKKDLDNQANHSLTVAEIPNDYGNSLIAAGTFIYSQYKDIDTTLSLYKRAVSVSPANEKAYLALGVLYTGIPGKCTDAVLNLSESVAINSYQDLPYFLLYNQYLNCFKDKQKAQEVADTYASIFQRDFQKDLKNQKKDLSILTN